MKIALFILASTMAFNVSAKSLTCKATLTSTKENEEKFFKAVEWMQANGVTDESKIPESMQSKPVAVDTRSVKLDIDGSADLGGIIVESYEAHGISYNYAAYAENGSITYVGIENEVTHSGSGVGKMKNQTEVEFGSSSSQDGSALDVVCVIK